MKLPSRQARLALSWALMLILLAAGLAAAQDEQVIIEKSRQDYQWLQDNPRGRQVAHNWQILYDRFARIYAADPQGDYGSISLWWMARVRAGAYDALHRPEDFRQALDLYKRYTNHFPRSQMADDAQFNIGRLYEKAGDKRQAYLEYLKVTVNYPGSDMAAQAKRRLDQLERELKGKGGAEPPRPAPEPASPRQAAPSVRPASRALAALTELRHWSTPTYTRLVLSLERPVSYATGLANRDAVAGQPNQLYIDLRGSRLDKSVEDQEPAGPGLLKAAQARQSSPDGVRVALDLKHLTSYKVFTLDNPFRIIVDCFADDSHAPAKPAPAPEPVAEEPDAPASPAATPAAPPASETASASPKARKGKTKGEAKPLDTKHARRVPRGQATTTPNRLGLAAQLGLCVNRVVIDPGHGGKDPGAIWQGLKEKDLVLDIAKRVRDKVTKLTGCEALLTRSQDVFIPLENRTAFANTHEADLFVSIHINAATNTSLNGIETYFLNLASDEASMRVAARENAATHRSISDLQNILNDLMLNSKINESNNLARTLQNSILDSVHHGHQIQDLKVKQAPFYVLIGARMPAVLTEVGFITNPQEHKLLSTAAYREQLAEGIARGIAAYSQKLKTARP